LITCLPREPDRKRIRAAIDGEQKLIAAPLACLVVREALLFASLPLRPRNQQFELPAQPDNARRLFAWRRALLGWRTCHEAENIHCRPCLQNSRKSETCSPARLTQPRCIKEQVKVVARPRLVVASCGGWALLRKV
jgi:hypothetical protein